MDESKTLGGEQELRTSTTTRAHPILESNIEFLGDQKGLFHNFMTHFWMPVKR